MGGGSGVACGDAMRDDSAVIVGDDRTVIVGGSPATAVAALPVDDARGRGRTPSDSSTDDSVSTTTAPLTCRGCAWAMVDSKGWTVTDVRDGWNSGPCSAGGAT